MGVKKGLIRYLFSKKKYSNDFIKIPYTIVYSPIEEPINCPYCLITNNSINFPCEHLHSSLIVNDFIKIPNDHLIKEIDNAYNKFDIFRA